MRKLNFLRKSERKSVGTTLALTVGSPSAHRRYSALKHLAFMLLFLLGSLNVWGADPDPVLCTFPSSGSITNNSITVNSVTWSIETTVGAGIPSVALTNATYASTSKSSIKFGSSKKIYYSSFSLSTNYFSSYNVSAVNVHYALNGGAETTVTATQGNTTIGSDTYSTGQTWHDATMNTSNGTGGELTISFTTTQAIAIHSIEITYTTGGSSDPTVSVTPASWDFGTVHASAEASKVFSVSGSNLTAGNLTLTVPDGFSVDPSSIAVDGTLAATNVTVLKNTSTEDDYAGNLSITGGGLASPKTVGLTMTVDADPEPTGTFSLYSGAIKEGDYVLVGYSTSAQKYYAMNNTVTDNQYLGITETSISNNQIENPNESLVWTIAESSNGYYIKNGNEYLDDNATSNKNYAHLVAEPATTSEWNFAYNDTWTITNYGTTTTKKTLSFNIGNNRVACYTGIQSGNTCFYLYKKLVESAVTITNPEHGTVVVTKGGNPVTSDANVAEQSTLNVSIEPVVGYNFTLKAYKTGTPTTVVPIDANGNLTMPDYPITITADETALLAVNIAVNDANMGSATINGGAGPVYAEYADEVTLVATANPGYEFVNWTVPTEDIDLGEDAEKANGAVAVIGAAGTITANFKAQSCSVLDAPVLDGTIATTYNSATINWAAVANAGGYNVEVKLGDVVKGSDAILEAPLSYTVNNLEANTTYNYTIQTVGDGTTYCEESGVLAGSFTTADYPSVAVTYSENGNEVSGGSKKIMTAFDLPTEVSHSCAKTFVGWTTKSDFADGDESLASYYAKGAEFTIESNAAVTLYAVYADVTGGGTSTTNIKYTSTETTTNMTGENQAETLVQGDATGWSVVGEKGGNSNNVGLNKAQDIRLYYHSDGGNTLTITAPQTITSVALTFTEDSYNNAWVKVENETVTLTDGVYPINNTTFVIGNANTSNVQVRISNIAVNFASAGTASDYSITCTEQVATPTFTVEAGTYYAAQNIEIEAAEGATVYYTTDGTTPSSTNGTEYTAAISLNERAITIIKAIAVKAGMENSEVAEAQYNINLPYSVAEFNELTLENNKEYAVRGIISQIDDVQSGKLTYYISANGATEGQLKLYKGLGLEKATFSAVTDVNKGDNVTVVGTWSTQHSNLNQDNWMLEYTAREHASYAIEGALTASSFDDGDAFDAAILNNLTVKETFTNGYYENVAGVTFNAGEKTAWADGDTKLTVNAVLNEVTIATKDFDVTVSSAQLSSIALKADDENYQTKVVYYLGESFVAPTIIATLDDKSTFPAEATYVSGFDNANAGVQEVTVSYTRGAVTETTTYNITMKAVFDNEDAPHTVAKAIELIEASAYQAKQSSTDYMWVSGKVSGFNGTSNKNYYISDDGTATSQLYVYSGSYFDGVAFTDGNKLHVGDEVILKATILNYNGSTAELTNSQVVYQLRAGALTVADVAALEIGQELAEADLTINRNGSNGAITFSCDENDALEVVENGTKLRAKGEAEANVTVTATMAADNTEGQINFTEASTTFTVHVVPAQTRYAVTFNMDGGSADPEMSLGDQLENANVVIPAGTFTKDGYKFNGWVVKETESGDAVAVSEDEGVYSFTMPAAAVTVTAQWLEGMDASWVAATWASDNYITSNTNLEGDYSTIAVDANISLIWNKATGSNVPAYNSSSKEARLYQNTTLQIAAEGKLIKKITFTFTQNYEGALSANVGTYSSNKWTGLANAITFTNTSSTQARIKSINIEYINGTITTLSIEDVSLKLSEGTKNLSISCNVDPTPAISYEIATADQEIATIENGVVTAHAVGGPINVTASIAQGSNYTAAVANFTITVTEKTQPAMSFPAASYNANLGSDFEEPALTTDPEEIAVTYSSSVPGVATVDEATGVITLVGEGETVITAAFAGNDDYSANSATYTLNVADPYKDVLTAALIGQSSYGSWNDKTFGYGDKRVKYAGNSTTGTSTNAGAIQMRVQNPSGIVTTTAIGYLKSISATAHTGNAKTLEIYAKGSAYESSADLYSNDASVKGEKIGTIGKDGGAMAFETGKAYSDNYKYIGIKANGGAVYYDDITITWTPVVFEHFAVTYKAGEATGDDIVESIEEGSNISLKAANTFEAPEGKIFNGWKMEGEENIREAGSKYTVTEAVTFVAQWISVYTITYKAGEGTGDDVVVANVPVGNYKLAANTFEAPENKEFAGWKLNNEGDVLAANSDFNVTANAEFTAQWSIVKQPAGLAYATTSYTIIRGREFTAPTLTNEHNVEVIYSGNNDAVATVDATTGAITLQGGIGTVTVTATFAGNDYYYAAEVSYTLKVLDANLAGGWERLTASGALINGMKVIIAEHVTTATTLKTMGAQNPNNRAEVTSALDTDDKLVSGEGTAIFTLVKVGEGTYAFKTADNKYLYAASSGSNHLKSQAKIDGNATWTISLSGDGKATITAQGENTRNLMRYNSGNEIFSCYGSGQQDIALYSKTVGISSGETDASTLDEYADVVVADGGKLVINAGTKPLGNITGNVEVNAPLQAEGVHLGVNNTMEVNSTVNVPSFSISVQLGSTGKATNVNVSGNGNIAAPEGYVDMELSDNANPDHWHSFTVPFEVDALNGIYDAETGSKLQNEVNYAIMDYHGDIRANGDYGWKKYRGILQPGVFYLITIDGESKVLRFMKKTGSSYVAGNSMEMTYYGDGDNTNTNNGWCGVGNQNMFNGYVPQAYVAQVLNATGTGYEAVDNSQAMSACIPFFIQVDVTVNLVMQTSQPNLAPRRTVVEGVERMKVFFGNENYTDKLFISASEEATNEYEIGKDLLKMTMTNTPSVPQIFGNAYGNKLCMVNAPMTNDQATYGLTLYAPQAGEYTISAPAMDNADLYLTLNGAIIWNLSMGEYTSDFAKGNNEGYGLLLVKKAPQVTTGVENAEANETGVQKVIINEHVYILRAEQMYDVTGKLVK